MSDPRIDRLSTAIAAVLVALVDIAREGESVTLAEVAQAAAPSEPDPGPERKTRAATPKADQPTTVAKAQEALAEADKGVVQPALTEDRPEATLNDAKALVVKIVQTKGRDAAVALLESFNALTAEGKPSAVALKDDQIAPFCEAAREVLES